MKAIIVVLALGLRWLQCQPRQSGQRRRLARRREVRDDGTLLPSLPRPRSPPPRSRPGRIAYPCALDPDEVEAGFSRSTRMARTSARSFRTQGLRMHPLVGRRLADLDGHRDRFRSSVRDTKSRSQR